MIGAGTYCRMARVGCDKLPRRPFSVVAAAQLCARWGSHVRSRSQPVNHDAMQIDDPVKPSTASLARLGSLIAPFSSIPRPVRSRDGSRHFSPHFSALRSDRPTPCETRAFLAIAAPAGDDQKFAGHESGSARQIPPAVAQHGSDGRHFAHATAFTGSRRGGPGAPSCGCALPARPAPSAIASPKGRPQARGPRRKMMKTEATTDRRDEVALFRYGLIEWNYTLPPMQKM